MIVDLQDPIRILQSANAECRPQMSEWMNYSPTLLLLLSASDSHFRIKPRILISPKFAQIIISNKNSSFWHISGISIRWSHNSFLFWKTNATHIHKNVEFEAGVYEMRMFSNPNIKIGTKWSFELTEISSPKQNERFNWSKYDRKRTEMALSKRDETLHTPLV